MITLENISKKFGNTQALKGVALMIRKGCITGLIGKNGSGKSTLINILTGLIQSYDGKVSYQDLQKNGISLASESFGFLSFYKTKKILEIFRILKNANQEDVEKLIDHLELTDHLDKPVKDLSQGNKQRLNIACAILGDPKLVILDEPNNGLDPSGFIMLRELVLDLKAKGKTVIIASHLLSEIEQVCDHILFLNEGKVIADEKKSVLVDKFGSLEQAYLQMMNS
jgi:ABC-2 type transport system ATP-binding protein